MLAFEQLLCCVIFIIFNASIYMCLNFSGFVCVCVCVCVCVILVRFCCQCYSSCIINLKYIFFVIREQFLKTIVGCVPSKFEGNRLWSGALFFIRGSSLTIFSISSMAIGQCQ